MHTNPDVITEYQIEVFINAGACEDGVAQAKEVGLYSKLLFKNRQWVAWCDRTPPEVLELLSYDYNEQIRMEVAVNSATPEKILRRLSVDVDWMVVMSTINNPHTPEDVLKNLMINYHWEPVRDRAKLALTYRY